MSVPNESILAGESFLAGYTRLEPTRNGARKFVGDADSLVVADWGLTDSGSLQQIDILGRRMTRAIANVISCGESSGVRLVDVEAPSGATREAIMAAAKTGMSVWVSKLPPTQRILSFSCDVDGTTAQLRSDGVVRVACADKYAAGKVAQKLFACAFNTQVESP